MITDQDPKVGEPAADRHWARLLDGYRRTRARVAARVGEQAAAQRTAALGHELALGAPAPIAAALFDPAAGPGAAAGERDGWVGPLWEVLAARQPWAVLARLPLPEPVRTLAAHTRVLLGEDLTDGREVSPGSAVPLVLLPWEQAGWEPAHRVTAYRADGAATSHFPLPDSREGLGPVRLPAPGPALPGAEQPATAALRGLCDWLDARCLRGTAPQAAALFAGTGAPHVETVAGYLPFATVYPALVRAGSGAGAYGRSGGAARGRLAVWRVLAAMADPAGRRSVAGVAALVARMRCFTWCESADEVWHLHLALEDPATGLAWAVSGSDYD
ncbi:hypothetical protein [Kitasatospora sp. NBC_01266]|uniref:hypothetical protein n=1 Tax=Kitasatospora sp. NBC_01266 TaxID=2903572 RepID=UPI002E346D9F|nr:hypothetical protein [Kitasatospora sp. NBC_01266]